MTCTSQPELFEKYGKGLDTLIETGSYKGNGIASALKAGFSRIVSFEISEQWVDHCRHRFAKEIKEGRVEIVQAPSDSDVFKIFANSLKKPALFWLDAHKMNEPKSEHNYPLVDEVTALAGTNLRHVFLMDDVRHFERYGTSVSEVASTMLNHCDRYVWDLDSCRTRFPKDVLCVYPEELFNEEESK